MTLIPGNEHLTIYSNSLRIAQKIHPVIVRTTGFRDLGIRERPELTGFQWSEIPVVLLELGYLTNAREERALMDEGLQHQLAVGIAEIMTHPSFLNALKDGS